MALFGIAMIRMASAATGKGFAGGVILAGIGSVMMPVLTGMIAQQAAPGRRGNALAAVESLSTLDRVFTYKIMSNVLATSIAGKAPIGLCFYYAAAAVACGAISFELMLASAGRNGLLERGGK